MKSGPKTKVVYGIWRIKRYCPSCEKVNPCSEEECCPYCGSLGLTEIVTHKVTNYTWSRVEAFFSSGNGWVKVGQSWEVKKT